MGAFEETAREAALQMLKMGSSHRILPWSHVGSRHRQQKLIEIEAHKRVDEISNYVEYSHLYVQEKIV